MSSLILSMVFDGLMAVLLAVTIGFCWKLQQRIRVLQDSRSELAALVTQFDQSTERAKTSILEIQNASRLITESIQTKLDKANYIADDLTFLTEKATKLAGNFDSTRRETAPAASLPQTAVPIAAPRTASSQTPPSALGKPARSKAEQELLDALKAAR